MKTDEQEVINFLLTTEIIPLCLRIMESGSELSKTVCYFIFVLNVYLYIFISSAVCLHVPRAYGTSQLIPVHMRTDRLLLWILCQVATFILQKILLDDTGLAYICQTYERFSHVAMILVSTWWVCDWLISLFFFFLTVFFFLFRGKWCCSFRRSHQLVC